MPAVYLVCSQTVPLIFVEVGLWMLGITASHHTEVSSGPSVTVRRSKAHTHQHSFYAIHDLLSVCPVLSFVSQSYHNTYNQSFEHAPSSHSLRTFDCFLRQGFSVALEPILEVAFVEQAGLKLTEIHLPLLLECWD